MKNGGNKKKNNKEIISISKLNVIYNKGKPNEFHALHDINVKIYANEYVAIFGPSGCGKSTLLNSISGLERGNGGVVRVSGKEITKMNSNQLAGFHRSNIGMIFQAYNLIATLGVLDNVMLPQIFMGISLKKRKPRAVKLLEVVGLGDFTKKRIQEMSGGQQQRVGIARALINDPPIILADEPVGNLDSKSAVNVMQILDDLNKKQKKTIILVTHEPQYLRYADRVFYMKDGRIVRETVNKDRVVPFEKKQAEHAGEEQTVIQSLAKAYPYLSNRGLKVRALSSSFAIIYSEEERERFESIIGRYLDGKINASQLFHLLDLPYKEGGMGLYKQTAKRIANEIINVMHTSNYFYNHIESAKKNRKSLDSIIRVIYKYLKSFYGGNFSIANSHALKKIIEQRITTKISREQFRNLLNSGLKRGGAGFNERTARNLTRALETILVKYH